MASPEPARAPLSMIVFVAASPPREGDRGVSTGTCTRRGWCTPRRWRRRPRLGYGYWETARLGSHTRPARSRTVLENGAPPTPLFRRDARQLACDCIRAAKPGAADARAHSISLMVPRSRGPPPHVVSYLESLGDCRLA